MANYSLSIDAAGARRDNEQIRNINALFPYGNGTYKTISSITRRGGIWCNCGGSSQSVTLSVYDQLLDGTTLIKTSNTVECKTYGRGPTEDNYALTTFDNWTQAQSNAATKAWAAGTLTIKRIVTIKSYTDSGHGSPVFRDGVYSDVITIAGATVPFTQYGPTIAQFDVFRSDNGDPEDQNPESEKVYARIKLTMKDSSGITNSPKLLAYWAIDSDPTTASDSEDLSSAFGLTAANLNTEKIVHIPGTWDKDKSYHFKLYFHAGEEVGTRDVDIVSRAFIPLYIADNNNGVAVGQYSSATETEPKFESRWPAHFYGGIDNIGDDNIKLLKLLGIQNGSETGQEVASGVTVDYDVVFEKPYASAPCVVIGMMLGGELAVHSGSGRVSCALISASATGFKVRAYNYTGLSDKPVIGFTWAAFGKMA